MCPKEGSGPERVFLKLGGSLITDKRREETPRQEVIQRLAREIRSALTDRPDLQLVLGHGSGSYGHFCAKRYNVHKGYLADWRGYAETAAAAQRLNRLVVDALLEVGLCAVSLQPSASARCREGELEAMAIEPVERLLEYGAVPLVYGDVALDVVRGCTILSTEQILIYLARFLRPSRILLAGEVEGVFTADPLREPGARLIAEITPRNYAEVECTLTTSFGVDVTGGMLSKVQSLYRLVLEQPSLEVHLITGQKEGLVYRALVDPACSEGTRIRYEAS
ncbi:MAG: isopentenyl phosphate kinase family protein [Chloroflexi bacterium]|nr:isopentenyl phosphate kinase family protein [Chloroflexota bacterium]